MLNAECGMRNCAPYDKKKANAHPANGSKEMLGESQQQKPRTAACMDVYRENVRRATGGKRQPGLRAFRIFLWQYRTELAVQMRSQIFRQIV